jgi:hypothetical protein
MQIGQNGKAMTWGQLWDEVKSPGLCGYNIALVEFELLHIQGIYTVERKQQSMEAMREGLQRTMTIICWQLLALL